MEQTENEIRHWRHEQEIEYLNHEVKYLSRRNKVEWLVTPVALILLFGFLWSREDQDVRLHYEDESTTLSVGGVEIRSGGSTYAGILNFPTPGVTLRDGPTPYRIAVVRGKLVAESTDQNGKAIVKVLLDNGDSER
ncbi:MAG: hypothetical protein M3R13_00895 [Armatimonadota bacterium]|nr:hypothetical protein [Armatimonadota bacterium]